MTPLKVAMLTQVYLPFIGGAEKQLAAVLQRLPAYGIEPMVITRRHDASPVDDRVEGIPVHRIEVGRHRELASITYTLKGILAQRRFRPDVVHAFELRSPSTTAVAWRALSGTPVLSKVLRGGTLGDIAALSRKPSDRMRLQRILRKIDAFAVISREIDDELAAEGVLVDRRLFIPNGVDLQSYTPATATERIALRNEFGLGAGPVALFAGRLEREKQVDRLIEIWPRVRAAVPGATLVVVGTGSLQPGLAERATEGVRLVGKQTAMRSWYAASDVFVLPSLAEGLSNALLEAMAMGLRCVATEVGAAPDLLGDGLGRLVPVGDADALSSALIAALTEAPDERHQQQVRARIERDYSLEATARKLAEAYRKLARRPA
jgi:glycosyltransferase involved in cell wall biosynthesis